MSKDLLAELDTFYNPSSTAKPSQQPHDEHDLFSHGADEIATKQHLDTQIGSVTAHAASNRAQEPGAFDYAANGDLEDDDWGEFEDAGKDQSNGQPNTTLVTQPKTPATKAAKPKLEDNVLFDADYDYDDEPADDYGEYEGGNSGFNNAINDAGSKAPQQAPPIFHAVSQGLIDLDFEDSESPHQVLDSPWQAESTVSSFRISTPAEPDRFVSKPKTELKIRKTAATQAETKQSSDEWAEFDDWADPPTFNVTAGGPLKSNETGAAAADRPTRSKRAPAKSTVQPHIQAATEEEVWDDFESTTDRTAPTERTKNPSLPTIPDILPESSNPSTLPPTNVPPPSLVFTLFAPVVIEAQTGFFQPLAALTPPQRTEALRHSSAQDFIRSYIAIGTIAARTIAGRKLRWKRDTRLSQSMRIGAAGGKGMKLTGVDKSELAKEDREVDELVRVWNSQVGKLGAVVAPTKLAVERARAPPLGTVPDLKTVMQITTAKEGEGGVPSQRFCALCGLKREERLAGVERADVGDAFGEWWVDGTYMHRTCRNFWEARSGDLRTR